MKVEIKILKEISKGILLHSGLSDEDAEIVIKHLLDEELLKKHSHGFIRMPAILNNIQNFNGKKTSISEKPSEFALHILHHNTLGLVAAYKTAEYAISIAKEKGFAIVSSIGYSGTTGALGYYGRMIASEGLIGIISCSSEYAVAPWGGKDAILGTNPLAIAIPNKDEPIISDFSTAAMTYGDLMLAMKEGKNVPYGIVLDKDGKPSQDPDDANNGCQLPMAGHKGYALGLAIEVLAGLFIGAKAGKDAVPGSDGILVFALKPDLFVPQNQYLQNLSSLICEIKNSQLAFESSEIRIPGESSIKKISAGYELGVCEIPDVVYKELLCLQDGSK